MASRKMEIRKDDMVVVLAGKDKGKKGKVLRVLPSADKVVVEGINIIKRHTKPTQNNPQGGIIERPAPIDRSNLMALCGKCNKATRIRIKETDKGERVRVCRHCGAEL